MSGKATIGLSKLFLWPDPSRIQTWPKLLAAIDPSERFRTLADIARKHLSSHETSRRHVGEVETVRGFPGLEKKQDRILLKGVGIMDSEGGGFILSELGRNLRDSYLKDPEGKQWARVLGRALAQREPRTRCMLRLLSGPETYLVFSGNDWFEGANTRTRFYFPDSDSIFPFVDKDDGSEKRTLRSAIDDLAWWSLGEWRNDEFLDGVDSCVLEGVKGGAFSLDSLSTKMRAAFEVFGYLGVIRHNGPETWLDQDAAVEELGVDVAADFGWIATGGPVAEGALDIIGGAIHHLSSESGYVVASQLRAALRERGFGNPDKEVGALIQTGKMVLEGEEHGQSRHGEGLFGDPGKQLVRLRIVKAN